MGGAGELLCTMLFYSLNLGRFFKVTEVSVTHSKSRTEFGT